MTNPGEMRDAPRHAGYPSIEDVTRALELVARGRAYGPEPLMSSVAAPQPTAALRQWLQDHKPLPSLPVLCDCTWRLGKWKIDGGYVMPDWRRPTRFGPTNAIDYTEAVAAGKGSIKSSHTHDARGTITYQCKKCLSEYPVRAERRMRLYLETLFLNKQDVVLRHGKL